VSRLNTLSTAARIAMFSPQTDKVFLPLIKIEGAGISTPVRLVRDGADLSSTVEGSSNLYTHFPFNIFLPDDKDDGSVKTVQLTVDGIDQSIVALVRPLVIPPTVTLWIVVADTPNVKEVGPLAFVVSGVSYGAESLTFTLAYEDRLANKLEGLTFDPINFPGVH